MKIKQSPLKLLDFVIINSNYRIIQPSKSINLKEAALAYDIDLNYAIKNDTDFYKIFIKAEINLGPDTKSGYSIFAEGVAIFKIDNNISEDDKKALLNYSSVPIALNYLRGYISNLTSYGPFGKYTLPSFDTKDLIIQKSKSTLRHKKEKK